MEGLVASASGKMQKAFQSVKPAIHFPVVLGQFGKQGNGLRAAGAIPREATILEVRENVAGSDLAHLDALKEKLTGPILKFVDETVLQGNTEAKQRMRIAFQFSNILRDRGHPLFPYLDVLPLDNLSFPIYWKSPSATFSQRLREEIVDSVSLTRSIYEKIYNAERKIISNVSFEEFMWTHYMALSRSVDYNGQTHFVPIFDLLNHSFTGNNVEIQRRENVWSLIAKRDISANEQLLRDYGPLDSYKYITRWGFFEPGNPHTCYYAHIENIPEWDRIAEVAKIKDKTPISELTNVNGLTIMQMKKRMLMKHGLSLMVAPLPIKPPAGKLEAALRILFLQPREIQDLGIKDVDAAIEQIDPTQPISKENEQRVKITAIKVASFYLNTFSEDWQADMEMCIALESEEKEILTTNRDYYMSQQRVSVSAQKD